VTEFKQYRRKQIAELREWQPGDNLDTPVKVSISAADAANGSPKQGDMIARNPVNHEDQWLVAAAYFADNFEPADAD
jgi:Holliday junction resolvase RusA-like endonuclease